MKTPRALWTAAILALALIHSPAATLYVSLNSTNPVPPFADWGTAATNIQDAVDAATNGDLILVTNGVYQTGGRTVNGYALTNRVVIDKAVMVQSVNGPTLTVIQGNPLVGTNAVRCVYLTNNAVLMGFTLAFGATLGAGDASHERSGGGVWCEGASALLSTCIIVTNSASVDAGGADSGTVTNCVLAFNSAAVGYGGGARNSTLDSCRITNNLSGYGSGTAFCTVNNCLLVGNQGDGAEGGTLNNCTIAGNGGLGANGCTLNNCIIYFNGTVQHSIWGDVYQSRITNCCLSALGNSFGPNNLTNPPAFVDLAHGNFQLQIGSPCINAGTNYYTPPGPDLAGNARIVNGTVDMGAYEYQGKIRYVNPGSTNPIAPYSDWSIAATNIQDAVNTANPGDTVLVANGNYKGPIATTEAITIQSVNGLGATFIDGNQTSACANLADGSALIGFTLTNGYSMTAGAGVFCATTNVFIFNCLIISNSVYGNYGAVYSGTLSNCTISDNISLYGDGVGAAFSVLNNCTLSGNTVPQRLSQGGGAGEGGGAFECTLNRCVLVGNQSAWGGGAAACTLNNCLVANNNAVNYFAPEGDAVGGGLFACSATNCTIVNNTVYYPQNTSPRGGGVYAGTSDNCIIFANKFNYYSLVYLDNYSGGTFNNCCTTPLPANGENNFTGAPLFVNQNGGDYHLQSNSPCINSGNNSFVTGTVDLDGNPRIVGGTVDIGAYEYQTPTSAISYAWLQQYGLPTDGTADYADPDYDGMNNYQEWIAGTNPTNALSVLAMLPPVPTNNPSGLLVSWESVSNRTYFLQTSSNLGAHPAFSTIQSNIVGQAGLTGFTDTNAVGNGPIFYRVGVQ